MNAVTLSLPQALVAAHQKCHASLIRLHFRRPVTPEAAGPSPVARAISNVLFLLGICLGRTRRVPTPDQERRWTSERTSLIPRRALPEVELTSLGTGFTIWGDGRRSSQRRRSRRAS